MTSVDINDVEIRRALGKSNPLYFLVLSQPIGELKLFSYCDGKSRRKALNELPHNVLCKLLQLPSIVRYFE